MVKLLRPRFLAAIVAAACALQAATAHADILLPFAKPKTAPAAAKFDAGVAALKGKDLVAAEKAFRESVALDAKAVGSVLGLAQVALERGDSAAAKKLVHQAVTAVPDSFEAHLNWGRMLYAERNFKEAEAAFRTAHSLDRNNALVLIDLGDLYMTGLGKAPEAVTQYRAAVALDPQHAGAHYALGMALGVMGANEEAEKSFRTSVQLTPKNPLPAMALARLYLSTKRPEAAIATYSALLKELPTYNLALVGRAQALMDRNDDAAAWKDVSQALKANAKSADAHLLAGMLHQRQRRLDDARTEYLTVIQLDAKRAIAYNNLAWITVEQKNNLAQGLEWAQRAVTLSPKTAAYQDTLGWVQRARGDLKAAETALEKATALTPPRASAFYHLGVVRQELQQRDRAIEAFRRALAIDASSADAADARNRLKALGAS